MRLSSDNPDGVLISVTTRASGGPDQLYRVRLPRRWAVQALSLAIVQASAGPGTGAAPVSFTIRDQSGRVMDERAELKDLVGADGTLTCAMIFQ
jgi:hypothetical protein